MGRLKHAILALTVAILLFSTIGSAINIPLPEDFVRDCESRGGTIELQYPQEENDSGGPQSDLPSIPVYACNIPERSGRDTVRRCSDRTRYSRCSEDQPLYCSRGRLVADCTECGCPGELVCKQDGGCGEETTTIDETTTTVDETTTSVETTTLEPVTTLAPTTTSVEPTTTLAPETTVETVGGAASAPTGQVIAGQKPSKVKDWVKAAAWLLALIVLATIIRKRRV